MVIYFFVITTIIVCIIPFSLSRALVAVVTYFVVGGVFMYVSRGARGVEVIPQAHFWLAIPGLVKVSEHTSCCEK